MPFSVMQNEYFEKATHRWNFKTGATRSGKTYMDYFVIPKRIRRLSGAEGLYVILGNTKSSLQRNIIAPLKNIYGDHFVSDIRSDNTAMLFGEEVYCLGADKISQVDKIRGSSIKYCYGDEVATWHVDVLTMLKSRLDKAYSCFDGTCNPEYPTHWLKQFIDSDADIFSQKYTIDDNPFLPDVVKENLKREYWGTVFYDRYILGEWVTAEGLIYKLLANETERFMIDRDKVPPLHSVDCGEDFGGNKSGHAIVCSGIGSDGRLYFTKAKFEKAEGTEANGLSKWSDNVFEECYNDVGEWLNVYADSAEQVLINTIRGYTRFSIYNALKKPIIDRVRFLNILIGSDRVRFVKGETEVLVEALCSATWDDKKLNDERLDNGSYNNDIIDAAEYSFEYKMDRMVT